MSDCFVLNERPVTDIIGHTDMARQSKGRTRRSKGEQAKRMRSLLIRSLLIVCGLLLLGLLAWNWTLSWLQGDSFRAQLETNLSESTGAEIRLQNNLVIDGNRVGQTQVTAEHLGAVDSAQIERLSMEIERTELLSRRLHINKLTMEEGSVVLWAPIGAAAEAAEEAPAETPTAAPAVKPAVKPAVTAASPAAAPAAAAESSSFFSLQGVQLDLLECKNADISFTTGDEIAYALMGSSLTAAPMAGSKEKWQASLQDGHLTTPYEWLRACNLKHANIIYNGKTVNITDSRFMLTPGEIRLQARYGLEKRHWTADMSVNKADVHRLLNEDWKKKLTGELYGKLVLSGDGSGVLKGSGNMSLQQAVLEGLPFLSELKIDNTYPYRTLQIEKANCRISFPYADKRLHIENAWLFDNIDIRSKGGLLRVTGHVIIGSEGELGGTLTLGVPQGVMQGFAYLGPVVQQIFNGKGDAGYAWVNINLSGTLDDPQEDLSVRLSTLLANALPQVATKAAADAAQQGVNTAAGIFADFLQQVGGTPAAPETNGETSADKPDTPVQGASDIIRQGLDILF